MTHSHHNLLGEPPATLLPGNPEADAELAAGDPPAEVAAHMFTNYDGVLKIDGEVGNKKTYDPRSYLKVAEQAMAARVAQGCEVLKSAGRMIAG